MTVQIEWERSVFNSKYQTEEYTILAATSCYEDCMSNKAENHTSWIATHTLIAWLKDEDSQPHQDPNNMCVRWFFDNTEWERNLGKRFNSLTIYRLRVRPHKYIKGDFMLLEILERNIKDLALQKILDRHPLTAKHR